MLLLHMLLTTFYVAREPLNGNEDGAVTIKFIIISLESFTMNFVVVSRKVTKLTNLFRKWYKDLVLFAGHPQIMGART